MMGGSSTKEVGATLELHDASDTLQNLAVDEVRERDGGPLLDQLAEMLLENSPMATQEIDPYGGVDDDHERDDRSSSRSPSHRTLPRRSRISLRFASRSNSRRARSTS